MGNSRREGSAVKATITFKLGSLELAVDLSQELAVCNENHERIKVLSEASWLAVKSFHQVMNWANAEGLQAFVMPPEKPTPSFPVVVSNGTEGGKEKTEPQIITVPVVKLSKGSDEGRDIFKVYGGNFTKYGVPAYADSCVDRVGLFALNYGQHNPEKPMLATIQMRGKDPYRVTEIIFNG